MVASRIVLLTIHLILLVYFAVILQSRADDSFPDILQHLNGKDKFRFYYELNWLSKDESVLNSKLVDESYSVSSGSGRLLVNEGTSPKSLNEYSTFLWFSDAKLQESFWLRPFICPAVRRAVTAEPTGSGLLFSQDILNELFKFKGQTANKSRGLIILHGLSALLANVAEKHAANLRRIEKATESDIDQQVDGTQVRWLLNTDLGYWLEFNFRKWNADEELSFDHLVGLRVVVFKARAMGDHKVPGSMVAQLTVLKASSKFPNSLVRLPKGYSCHHSALKPPFTLKNSPLAVGVLTKYVLEVTVTVGEETELEQDASAQLRPHLHEPSSIPQPSDTLLAPISNSSNLVLMVDRQDNSLSVISRLHDSGKVSARQQPRLSVWDLNVKRYFKVASGSCEGPTGFKSSLRLVGPSDKTPEGSGGCSADSERLVVQLSENVAIRLTANGLKWLTFEFQDRQNKGQLVDFVETDDGGFEVNYESFVRDSNLCLFYLDSGKALDLTSSRLLTSYKYLLKQDQWFPQTSSLQFFDKSQSKLVAQIDLRLAHQAPYRPWTTERHLVDLSPCKGGARQSALLSLEYPLDNPARTLLNQIQEPHELIRSSLFAHLRTNYLVTLARVPSIAVSIGDDMVTVEARLLDQIHLLHDSEKLGGVPSSVSSTQYLDWLSRATRSVLANNLESCAEYCQLYRCEVYAFCKYSLSCYIYSPIAVSDKVSMPLAPASFFGLDMVCTAYRVRPQRSENQEVARRRATTWSLEEILGAIEQSVDEAKRESETSKVSKRSRDPLSRPTEICPAPAIRVTPTLKGDGPRSCQMLRLDPSFVHSRYDNPQQQQAASMVAPNPFVPAELREQTNNIEQLAGVASNFRVALGGQRLVETSELSVVKHYHQLQHLDLANADGYLSVEGHTLDECLRLCLADTDCASVSYCWKGSHCLVSRLNQTGLNRMTLAQLQPDQVDLTDDAGSLYGRIELQKDPSCTIMMRTYSDQFERLEIKMLFTFSDKTLDNVLDVASAETPEDCATRCVQSRLGNLKLSVPSSGDISTGGGGAACLSYDFCQPINSENSPSGCVLYNRHLISTSEHLHVIQGDHGESEAPKKSEPEEGKDLLSVLKRDIGLDMSSFCWHYVRNFLSDFHKIAGRRLPAEMRSMQMRNFALPELDKADQARPELLVSTIDGSDVSLARCARLCEEDPNCGAFEYCAMSHGEVPGGLYLSCALGNNETLAMIPARGAHGGSRRYVNDMTKLSRYRFCSIYAYRALSLVVGHKKKNLRQLGAEILNEVEETPSRQTSSLPILNLILFGVFFVLGLLVGRKDLDQFSFRRLQEVFERPQANQANGRAGNSRHSAARSKVASEGQTTSLDELRLETIGPRAQGGL